MPSQFDTIMANAKVSVDSQGDTSVQITDMTKAQLAAQLGLDEKAAFWSDSNYGLFTAIRRHLVIYKLDEENQTMAQSIKAVLSNFQKQWLLDNASQIAALLGDQVVGEFE